MTVNHISQTDVLKQHGNNVLDALLLKARGSYLMGAVGAEIIIDEGTLLLFPFIDDVGEYDLSIQGVIVYLNGEVESCL